ncbi:Glutamate synthase [NADPH] small chain [bioreactor metagenome]|uniref:Glutamate synthase [NADPH] small chain n=1 Tax=bioreactor metagenome TaxID=1076179 RepID=A0A645DYS0_9ZZZZ
MRQGAASVTQIEILPQPPEDRSASTPWPAWPWLLRTSSSHGEGGVRLWNVQSSGFRGEAGRVTGVAVNDVEWSFSPDGRPLEFKPVAGSDRVIAADLVLLAMGFTGIPPGHWSANLGLNIDARGRLQNDPKRAILVAGDAANGASLVVRAIVDGMRQAEAIDRCLKENN